MKWKRIKRRKLIWYPFSGEEDSLGNLILTKAMDGDKDRNCRTGGKQQRDLYDIYFGKIISLPPCQSTFQSVLSFHSDSILHITQFVSKLHLRSQQLLRFLEIILKGCSFSSACQCLLRLLEMSLILCYLFKKWCSNPGNILTIFIGLSPQERDTILSIFSYQVINMKLSNVIIGGWNWGRAIGWLKRRLDDMMMYSHFTTMLLTHNICPLITFKISFEKILSLWKLLCL